MKCATVISTVIHCYSNMLILIHVSAHDGDCSRSLVGKVRKLLDYKECLFG